MRTLICSALICLAAVVGGIGCNESKPATSNKMHHDCVVCAKHGNHMDVDIKANTPHAAYMGTTYYFCETSCRDEFMKNPEEFAASK